MMPEYELVKGKRVDCLLEIPNLETAWRLPIQGVDVLRGMKSLLAENGIDSGHNWETIALLGTIKTIKGLEYAASAISLLPADLDTDRRTYVIQALAAFELWRHGANIFDDFTDRELDRNEYRLLIEPALTESDLLILQNFFHFVGISKLIAMQKEQNTNGKGSAVPDIRTLFGRIYSGWRDKTKAMEQRKIWNGNGDPLQFYWGEHVAISTACFYQIPYIVIGLAASQEEQRITISNVGYGVGEIIHTKNDLQDLEVDILGGDFSYPVIAAIMEGILSIEDLSDNAIRSKQSNEYVIRIRDAGLIDQFVGIADQKIEALIIEIEFLKRQGVDCRQIADLIDHLYQRIHQTLEEYKEL